MAYAITGHSYVGEWKDNKKHSRGIFKYGNGDVYEGQFVNDVKRGRGKITHFPDTILEETYDGGVAW